MPLYQISAVGMGTTFKHRVTAATGPCGMKIESVLKCLPKSHRASCSSKLQVIADKVSIYQCNLQAPVALNCGLQGTQASACLPMALVPAFSRLMMGLQWQADSPEALRLHGQGRGHIDIVLTHALLQDADGCAAQLAGLLKPAALSLTWSMWGCELQHLIQSSKLLESRQ